MTYRVLADVVLIFHLLFIVFVVVGGLATLLWRWAPLVQVPAALWGIYIEVSGRICPLTPLENELRHAAGAAGHSGGFIEHYLLATVYPTGLTPSVQFFLAGLALLANALVYSFLWRRLRRKQGSLAA
ncbi:MAG: DUF2784 domain-containing protein [Deltaproteobacteria bacterium]|nr:DUF2784 domain-containing protein [Deltaproteobacteria bacterium]